MAVIRPNPGQRPGQKPKQSGGGGGKITAIIVIVIIILAVAGYFLYPIFFAIPAPMPPLEPATVVVEEEEIVEPDTVQVVEIKEEPKPAVVVQEVVRYDTSPTVERGLYIIVGSFLNRRNAEKFAEKLKTDLETDILFFEGSGLFRVSAGKYRSLREAYNDMGSVRIIEGCEEAWVVENR
jgi:hypothetical protein